MLPLIIDTQSPTRDRIITDYLLNASEGIAGQVRMDANLDFSVEPVVAAAAGSPLPWVADYEATDTFQAAIGLPDRTPTAGTFELEVGGGTYVDLETLAYNIAANALQVPLRTAFADQGKVEPLVTLIATGVYRIIGEADGAITAGFLVGVGTNLYPLSAAYVVEEDLGSASKPYRLLLIVRQSPMCLGIPVTALPAAGVTVTTTQAQSSTANLIRKIALDAPRTYGGSYSLSATALGLTATCGIATPTMTAEDIALLLAGHPNIYFREADGTPDNIAVTPVGADYLVEFIGSLGARVRSITSISVANPTVVTFEEDHNFVTGDSVTFSGTNSTPSLDGSQTVTVTGTNTVTVAVNVTVIGSTGSAYDTATPALTATNIDLVAPKGRSGTIDLNTIALYDHSLVTDSADPFELEFSVTRTRANGERRTIFGPTAILIAREIVDPNTMVPTPLPDYYTGPQIDAKFATGNLLYVDAVHGSDGSGTPERFDLPYLTLTAAKTAATSGDTIIVRPGTYNERDLFKTGVNWHFMAGASVIYTGSADGAVWDNTTTGVSTAVTCRITGNGVFKNQGSHATSDKVSTIAIVNASSNIQIECDQLLHSPATSSSSSSAFRHHGGTVTLKCPIVTSTNGQGIWWSDGEFFGECKDVQATATAVYSGDGANPYSGSYAGGYFWFKCNRAKSTGAEAIQLAGAATARNWMECDEAITTTSQAITMGVSKNYLIIKKVNQTGTGVGILCVSGENWVNAQKITTGTGASGFAISASGGTNFIDALQIEAVSGPSAVVRVSGGTTDLRVLAKVTSASTTQNGVNISAGTLKMNNTVFDAAAATSGNPVTKSGGTLIMKACTLVTDGSRAPIIAATAQTVQAWNCLSNLDLGTDTDVTITGAGNSSDSAITA